MSADNIKKNSLKLSFLTILSRIFGLVRDHFQATFFGIGPVAFAWEMALFLPGVLRNLLVEGGAAQAFIPIYTRSLNQSFQEARKIAGIILNFVFLMMLIVTLLSIFLTPYFLPLLTQQSHSEANLMIQLSWILLLFMLPMSLNSIFAGIANAHRYFAVPALAPIILNIGQIIGFLYLDRNDIAAENARILAYFFTTTSFIQLFLFFGYIKSMKIAPIFSLQLKHPVVYTAITVMLPAISSNAIFHINQMLDVAIASFFIPLEIGAVPALRFANRLIQLPTGIIGAAISTTILPILALSLSKKNNKSSKEEIISSLQFATFLTVPAMLGLLFLGEDIINLLFYGGEWTTQSTNVTWQCLQYYSLSIPFYSLNKIMISVFFAFSDTKTPLKVTTVSVVINCALNIILVQYMQHGGIALSTSIAAAIIFLQLQIHLYRKHTQLSWQKFLQFIKRSLPLWFLLISFLWFLELPYIEAMSEKLGYLYAQYFSLSLEDLPRYHALPKVILGVTGGACLYLGTAWYGKNPEMEIFRNLLHKRKK